MLSGYDKINEEFQLEETLGRPYALCAMQCQFGVREWAKRKGVEKKTLIYFEDGDKDKGNFEKRSLQVYGVRPKFLSKSEAVAFQPADWAGWKVRTLIQEAIKDNHTYEKGLRLMDSLHTLPKMPKDSGVLNNAALLEFCERYKIPRREVRK